MMDYDAPPLPLSRHRIRGTLGPGGLPGSALGSVWALTRQFHLLLHRHPRAATGRGRGGIHCSLQHPAGAPGLQRPAPGGGAPGAGCTPAVQRPPGPARLVSSSAAKPQLLRTCGSHRGCRGGRSKNFPGVGAGCTGLRPSPGRKIAWPGGAPGGRAAEEEAARPVCLAKHTHLFSIGLRC